MLGTQGYGMVCKLAEVKPGRTVRLLGSTQQALVEYHLGGSTAVSWQVVQQAQGRNGAFTIKRRHLVYWAPTAQVEVVRQRA